VNEGIVVGVDSGGTRTNVFIEMRHPDKQTVELSYEASDSLSGALANELILLEFRRILAPLEQIISEQTFPKVPVYIWVSAAGFTPYTRDKYLMAIDKLLPTLIQGRVKYAGIANDGVTVLLGSRADGVVVAGTGSTVYVRSSDKLIHQAGGNEWVASDEGSGFWIGMRGIREAYRDFENGRDSVLLQRWRQTYGVRPDDDRGLLEKLRELAVAQKDMKKDIARFAGSVCAAAERGDPNAQNIVKNSAEGLADVVAESIRRHFSNSEMAAGLRFVECGGLLSNDFYRISFEGQIEMRLLFGSSRRADIAWQRVMTGSAASLWLAATIENSTEELLKLDWRYRPAVARH
jgi:N-acetylglucosamine kinase-like BadF-type ATPase